MIQEFNLSKIISCYDLNDCYIENMEYEDGILKIYIDEILPETEAGYDDPEDFSNKYKGLIVSYKIIDENQCFVDIVKRRYFLSFRYAKVKSLEIKDYVNYFKEVKRKNATVEVFQQYLANRMCLISITHHLKSAGAVDYCDLHLYVKLIKYDWLE